MIVITVNSHNTAQNTATMMFSRLALALALALTLVAPANAASNKPNVATKDGCACPFPSWFAAEPGHDLGNQPTPARGTHVITPTPMHARTHARTHATS